MSHTRCWTLLLMSLIGLSSANALASPIEIRSWVTVSTPARPEVHLLILNEASQPVDFKLELGGVENGERLHCAGTNEPIPDLLTRFHYWNGVSFGDSLGRVPSKGWAHRSLLLGESGAVPPCNVPYRIEFAGEGSNLEPIVGTVSVPTASPPERGAATEGDISWEAMVEEHKLYKGRLVARIVVKNRQDHGVVLLLDHRILTCERGGAATWALHHGVVQGEDVGPVQVGPDGLGAFVAAIDTRDMKDRSDCRVSADLILASRDGLEKIQRIEFPLVPTGYLDSATKRR